MTYLQSMDCGLNISSVTSHKMSQNALTETPRFTYTDLRWREWEKRREWSSRNEESLLLAWLWGRMLVASPFFVDFWTAEIT